MRYKTLIAALIALTISAAAPAQPTCSRDAAPSREHIMQWKKDVVDRFATVIYLDANGDAIPENVFLQAIIDKHLPFDMKTQGNQVLHLQLQAPPVTPDCA